MGLEEALQRLLEILNQTKALRQQITDNHLHSEENELLYERWSNTRHVFIRETIRDGIEHGKKEWDGLLEIYPTPDKPFDINDVKDESFRVCIERIDELEAEERELLSYVFDTLRSEEEREIILKKYLFVRFPETEKKYRNVCLY